MSLKPFAAEGRLGVIPFADTMSLPAANSLLKIAEEPPEGGHLLFMAEEDNLIPTIRSRVWTVNFRTSETADKTAPPKKPAEWAAWIEKTRKRSLDELAPEAGAWARYLGDLGEWRASASIRNVIYISQKRHMPVSMVQDALMAILREGVPIGQIFGDLR
jgi:DNA polymerase-3 subunit delta'